VPVTSPETSSPALRAAAIAGLWAPEGVEYVEGAQDYQLTVEPLAP
jgi:hypothetical protein